MKISTCCVPVVTVQPTSEPLMLSEAKKQVEIADSDGAHDEHLIRAIQSARQQWEGDTDSVASATNPVDNRDNLLRRSKRTADTVYRNLPT